MTSRDLAFWLQGFYELTNHAAPDADLVRKHAELVLVTEPGSPFAISVKHLADRPEGLRDLVAAQFVHVIDATFPPPEKDPAHKPVPHYPSAGPPVYRC